MSGELGGSTLGPQRILLLGRQGAGKGLIGRLLASRIRAGFLSMGDLLRAEQRRGTENGIEIGRLIGAGDGVPPEISYELMADALAVRPASESLVIDGIPRRADETDRVRQLLRADPSAVVVLHVPTPIAVARLLTRQSCSACGMPHGPGWPVINGGCRGCGSTVEMRSDDDDLVKIHARLAVWSMESNTIVGHYARKGLVRDVAADAPVHDVLERVMATLPVSIRGDR